MRYDHANSILNTFSGITFSSGLNSLTVNGDSLLDGNITATSNINILNQNRIYFGDRHYAREDGGNKRLKFHSGGSGDYFRFIIGNEIFEAARIMDITSSNVLFRQDIVALKNYADVKKQYL